jgi:lipid-A-disaccharide synthase
LPVRTDVSASGRVDRGEGACRLPLVRVVVSAGEASGRVMLEQFRLEMARIEPGCEVVSLAETEELGPVFGFAEGLSSGWKNHFALSRGEEAVVRFAPDVVVLISFSGLHLALGRRLRQRGVPVLYLGPPQVWAWGGWRKRRLRKAADKVVCLFRFEEELLRRGGVDATYVGYPLLDSVVSRLSREQTLERLGLGPNERYVVFLPGSRPAEIAYHEPVFRAASEQLSGQERGIRGVMVTMDESRRQKSEGRSQRAEATEGGVVVVSQGRYDVMRHAECACAVSGTVTAELAILGVPMAVCYHLPWLSRVLARALVHIPHFALPNILAGTQLVPEVLDPEPQALARTLATLLRDSEERRAQLSGLARVAAGLGPAGAMERVCGLARELARTEGWVRTRIERPGGRG